MSKSDADVFIGLFLVIGFVVIGGIVIIMGGIFVAVILAIAIFFITALLILGIIYVGAIILPVVTRIFFFVLNIFGNMVYQIRRKIRNNRLETANFQPIRTPYFIPPRRTEQQSLNDSIPSVNDFVDEYVKAHREGRLG